MSKILTKDSLHASNSLGVIESPRDSEVLENLDDRAHMRGVLQITSVKSSMCHTGASMRLRWIQFFALQDLYEHHDGLASEDSSSNQLRFCLGTLKLTSRTSTDQQIQYFTEMKDYLD